ncbi:valacyclovir hydrolase, putative [Talaromyces stipitatus ATCC 10500]|uniref:Valacyclovir hydrolase, putative n=1 Tax=Talaromyces stipitatus (strain ATCC 10500 / CBS 375.48 / QM 6759 / NRRL 1006) TaxID=441959 RepID=B8M0N1_TALSN|nr:valacyclovir hydrolase, putative [Talaromyces stipitatus ATCC 10500]EED21414.1 valacyclovir hydrolase, putative [Talaromyces stipitatus ATCC 10500]
MPNIIVLPRPGSSKTNDNPQSIQAPSEADFVSTFGQLLPPASYLQTPIGGAAYYELPPTSANTSNPTLRVILLHGIQTSAIGLQPLAKALSSRLPNAHIVLLDLWGHGLTDTPLVAHTPSIFHFLLDSLITHLKWENVHLVGYSFGGSTIGTFATAYPHRVSSLALVAPAGLIRTESFDEAGQSYLRGEQGVDEEKVQAWILKTLEGGELIVPADWKKRIARGEVVAEAVRDWEIKNHKGHMASVVAIFRDGGVLDKHADLAAAAKMGIKNISIVGGTDDWSRKEDLQAVGFKDVVVIPQTGHVVVREKVSEVADVIEKFWKALLAFLKRWTAAADSLRGYSCTRHLRNLLPMT